MNATETQNALTPTALAMSVITNNTAALNVKNLPPPASRCPPPALKANRIAAATTRSAEWQPDPDRLRTAPGVSGSVHLICAQEQPRLEGLSS